MRLSQMLPVIWVEVYVHTGIDARLGDRVERKSSKPLVVQLVVSCAERCVFDTRFSRRRADVLSRRRAIALRRSSATLHGYLEIDVGVLEHFESQSELDGGGHRECRPGTQT